MESDTGNIDGLKDLQDLYKGDLIIEVWAAEVLGRKLRGAPRRPGHLRTGMGQGMVRLRASTGTSGPPKALGLVEDPLSVLNLDPCGLTPQRGRYRIRWVQPQSTGP